jgi:hypothetical protein
LNIRWTVVRRGLGLALAAMVARAALPQSAAAQDPLATAEPADSAAPGPGVSAVGAFARSVVLPGWGQAYVGSPGRGAVYFAMEAGTAWMTYKTWRQLEEARDVQGWMRDSGLLLQTEKLDLVDAREQQFEDWVTLSIFVLLFSGIDAFVTAQLADFDEHVGVRPAAGGGLGLQARIPMGPRR